MEILRLVEALKAFKAHGDIDNWFGCVCTIYKRDKVLGYQYLLDFREAVSLLAQSGKDVRANLEWAKKSYRLSAQDVLDDYLIYLEWNRPANERFWLPRRSILLPLAQAIQDLVDDKLDEVFLSMPPRVGKTSVLLFFVTWLIGKFPEKSNLYCAYSDVITSAFYNGVLEVLRDPQTYLWGDVFIGSKIAGTNSKDETLDIDRAKRYHSLTCRSLYGTLNGAVDCNGFLISDDLIGGIEEALNKDRMIAAWSKVDNNMIPRAKQMAKLLWCGTRWSIIDPAGLRMEIIKNNPAYANRRIRIINLPALNEKEESNFDYQYGVGFSTEYYLQRRSSFERNNDMASWEAQYQGNPIERQGALFEPGDMRFYNGVLPDEKHLVRVFMAIDPAYGGGDFTSAPVCYQYDDGRIFVHDVVYDDGEKTVTQPKIVQAVERNGVNAIQIEANKSTMGYKNEVDDMLKKKGLSVNITTKAPPNNIAKEARIFDKAPQIRQFYFLEEGKRNGEYSKFMQNVYSFKLTGKNKHDDSVDSLAMAVDMLIGRKAEFEILQRPF